jgi:hypothetical protein
VYDKQKLPEQPVGLQCAFVSSILFCSDANDDDAHPHIDQ